MDDRAIAQVEADTLLQELWKLLAGAQSLFKQQRVYRRAVALILGELFTFGRHTLTQILRSLGLVEGDWSAWYRLFARGRFDEQAAGSYLLRETLQQVKGKQPYVVGIDGVRIYRTGRQVAGSGWWPALNTAPFQRGLRRGQRFVEGAWLTPNRGTVGPCRCAGWPRRRSGR